MSNRIIFVNSLHDPYKLNMMEHLTNGNSRKVVNAWSRVCIPATDGDTFHISAKTENKLKRGREWSILKTRFLLTL